MLEYISKRIFRARTERIFDYLMMLLIIALLTTCQKEEVATREYPRLNTLEVSEINASGATFSAQIISGGLSQVKEFGFVWDTNSSPDIDIHDKLVVKSVLSSKTFGGIVHAALKKDVVYYMRGYVKTDKYVVYGKVVSFKSLGSEAPIITDYSPKSACWSDTIKITGKNFRYKKSGILVKLGDIVATVISSTDTTIKIVVPSEKNIEKVNLSVSIEGNTSVSPSQFAYLIPLISDINPLSATFNDTVFIHGINFFRDPAIHKVYFNGSPVTIVYASATLLKVLVPATLTLSQAKISITGPVNDIEFGALFRLKGSAIILSVEPQRGIIGKSIITLTGEQFSLVNSQNNLTINGIRAELLTVEERKITFKLPYNTPSGNSKISLSINNIQSEYKGDFESVSPWIKKIDLPMQTNGFNSAFTLNDKMYVQYRHSFNENNFFEYNPSINQLLYLARYPGMMENMGVDFVLNGKGYVGAGCFYSSYTGLDEFHSYDPVTNTWTQVGRLPNYTNGGPIGAIAFSVQNKAYLFGGFAQNYYTTKGLDYYIYDPSLDHWSLLGNMKKLINYDEWSKAAGFMINDNIYLCSGSARNYFYNYFSYKKTWMFDVTKDQWTQLADFPVEKEDAVGFSINGKGYVGTGSTNGQVKSDFYEYDPISDSWTRIADLPVKGSIGPIAVVIGGKAFVSANDNKEIWEFDPLKQ